ncbi:unnamed protein product [Linum tenue]|uniref:glycerophosphodiester phosphodiesterase n=1 Tax=Linum tenue TaxID=586396 RepID=A0AAV0L033_9ROSI|nr:unnamed protein product [Linum tenue]
MVRGLFFVLLLIHASSSANGADEKEAPWLTLNGKAPAVVAREGFSGQFPEDTGMAFQMRTYDGMLLLCSVQLTMDNGAVCQPDVEISKSTNVQALHPNMTKTYNVNGKNVSGYFTIDYTMNDLVETMVGVQRIMTRSDAFDGYSIMPFEGESQFKMPLLWINVPYVQFFSEHKMNMEDFIRQVPLTSKHCLSSPEIGFLKAMSDRKLPAGLKLYFAFHGKDAVEPTTKKTYGSIASDLAALKPIVAGIVVPKDYIWPVDKSNYLVAQPTTLVTDAHKLGLEVYASGFANDNVLVYNYSYDPMAEYLNFISNGQFSVDGLITDFPPTATDAIMCFGPLRENRSKQGQPLIITRGGAYGVYAPSTDLAYKRAVDDGADVIDCSVQMSQDGVAFCMISPDLTASTTAATIFVDRITDVKEIQEESGIFSFALSWDEIQTLQPQLSTPYEKSTGLKRNPLFRNKGKFVTLAQFLEFARSKSVTGILISLDNAPYLASKGLDLVTTVTAALTKAQYDKKSGPQVFIQSDDTSVLAKFKNFPSYKRILSIKEEISSVNKAAVEEIKKNADGVTLTRYSILPTNPQGFTTVETPIVETLHSANLTVFVSTLNNEYITLAFDYFADPTVEIATYTHTVGVDGFVTEYPKTASRYQRNPCSDINRSYIILPARPGSLLNETRAAPADPPKPALTVQDVVDSPLPEVAKPKDPPSKQKQEASTSSSSAAAGLQSTAPAVAVAVALLCFLTAGHNWGS